MSAELVDWNRLAELREYDTPEGTIVKEVISSLLDDASDRIEEIRRTGVQRDSDALRDSAHKLRGAASNVGALAVTECAAKLEDAARSGIFDDVGRMVDELELAFEKTRIELQRYVGD